MGKSCTKAAVLPIAESACGTTRAQPSAQPPRPVVNVENAPLPTSHRFFIQVHTVKARNLRPRGGGFICCRLDWDDTSFEKRTKRISSVPNPRWEDSFQFYWSVADLGTLPQRFCELTILEQPHGDIASVCHMVGLARFDLQTVATGPIHHDVPLLDMRGMDGGARLICDIRMAQLCKLIIGPVEMLGHLRETVGELDELEIEGVGTTRAAELEDEDIKHDIAESHLRTSLSDGRELERFSGSMTTSSGARLRILRVASTGVEAVDTKTSTPEEELESKLERAAHGGHQEADAKEPFLAQWQLTFTPTGTDQSVEYCSAWTGMRDQPYWNALSEDGLLSEHQRRSISSAVLDDVAPQIPSQLVEPGQAAVYPTTVGVHRLTTSNQMSRTPSAQLRMRPLSAAAKSEEEEELLSALRSAAPMHREARSVPANLEAMGHDDETSAEPPAHMEHLNTQATYVKLAEACRRGVLARDMLQRDAFPLMQLETTTDFLRQNHLKLSLWCKRFGEPKFYGEAWLPFFKIYDANIAQQAHRNFCDAYFHEKLWLEGRCVGHIEGILIFQNNPIVRQMLAGVHTEHGVLRVSPPVLESDAFAARLLDGSGQRSLPEEMKQLAHSAQSLYDLIFSKAQIPCGGETVSESAAAVAATGSIGTTALHSPTKDRRKLFGKLRMLNAHRSSGGGDETRDARTPHQVVDLRGSHQELHELCDQILQALRATHADTRRSFMYETTGGLVLAQKVFLELANHCLEFADYVPWQYRSTYSAILHQTLRRGELELDSVLPPLPDCVKDLTEQQLRDVLVALALAQHHQKTPSYRDCGRVSRQTEQIVAKLKKHEVDEVTLYDRRMQVSLKYWTLLHAVQRYCLNKLNSDNVFEGQKRYLCMFLCIMYFRLPKFRGELLAALLTQEEREIDIPEWRGTDFGLDAAALTKLENWQEGYQQNLSLDWSGLDEKLEKFFGKKVVEEVFAELTPLDENWHRCITSRGLLFFSYVEHWAKHVFQAISDKQELQWHFLPGYPTLLKVMLLEMKKREVTRFPDALLNCTGALLANERLLSVFIKVVFLRASVYDTGAVFAALNYVDYWVQVLSLRNQQLPSNFDAVFLRRGLDIVLGCDIGLSVAKGIWFIYKNLNIFKGPHLESFLVDLLFQKYFFTLFLNWSWLVRRCFVWLLLYRVCETARCCLRSDEELTGPDRLSLWALLELRNYLAIMNAPRDSLGPLLTVETPTVFELIATHVCGSAVDDSKGGTHDRTRHDMSSRLQVLKEAESITSAEEKAAYTDRIIPEECRVYIKAALAELAQEVQHFRTWVDGGSDTLPTMNIPASPLDSNVDVPPENW